MRDPQADQHPDQPTKVPGGTVNLPNLICLFRIAGAFVLVGIALAEARVAFVLLYLGFGVSDLIDGPLARWLGQQSDLGARLDSAADVLLSLSLLAGGVLLSWDWLRGELWLVGMAAASYALVSGYGLWRFGRWPSFHTIAAKLTHLLVALGGVCLILQWTVWPLRIAAIATVLTNLECLLILRVLRQSKTNVPSILVLLRRKP